MLQPPPPLSLFAPPAIYLCKRTMQNKARLELADYEAVSPFIYLFLNVLVLIYVIKVHQHLSALCFRPVLLDYLVLFLLVFNHPTVNR